MGFVFPFRAGHHVVIILLTGRVKIQWNLITYQLEANDIISISGRMVTQSIEFMEDSSAVIMAFTTEFALRNARKSRAIESFKLLSATSAPKISPNSREMETLQALLTYLMMKTQGDQEEHLDAKIQHAFSLIFYELSDLYSKYHPSMPLDLTRKEELSAEFIKLLSRHFREERSLEFYANALHVTTGHLSKMLKKVSGKSARHLIDEAVVLEAKVLLADRSLTIAKIAADLNFSDQSFFGKFFKKETGLSPSEYRQTFSQA